MLPLYYLLIAAAVALGGLLRPVSGTDFPHDVGAVLVHLGFLQHEVYPFREGFGIQGIVWTMSVAIIFYAVFGTVATRWLRHPFLWLLGSAVLALVWREWRRSNPQVLLQFPLFALDLGLGMTGAYVYVQLHRGGLAALRRHAADACLLTAGAGLFLFHFIVIWLVLYFTDIPPHGSPSSTLVLGALVLPISITLGWAGTHWVEHPLRMRAQRLAAHLDRRSAAPAVAPQAEPQLSPAA